MISRVSKSFLPRAPVPCFAFGWLRATTTASRIVHVDRRCSVYAEHHLIDCSAAHRASLWTACTVV